MPIKKTLNGIVIEARVKAGCSLFSIKKAGEEIIIEVSSPPIEGRANREIIKEIKRLLKAEYVEILKGLKSKKKDIFVKGNPVELELRLKEL